MRDGLSGPVMIEVHVGVKELSETVWFYMAGTLYGVAQRIAFRACLRRRDRLGMTVANHWFTEQTGFSWSRSISGANKIMQAWELKWLDHSHRIG